MIERLKGTVAHRDTASVILDVGGVGYGLEVTEKFARRLVPEQDTVIWVHTHVREDAIRLFGFPTLDERDLFVLLLSISGVGPKMAMAMLGTLDERALIDAVLAEDAERLEEVPGVGARQSAKILLELKPKVQKLLEAGKLTRRVGAAAVVVAGTSTAGGTMFDSVHAADAQRAQILAADLRSALENLGYKEREYAAVVKRLTSESADKPMPELLRRAIAELSASAKARPSLDEVF